MTLHRTYVSLTFDKIPTDSPLVARCECGWSCHTYGTVNEARTLAAEHLRGAAEAWDLTPYDQIRAALPYLRRPVLPPDPSSEGGCPSPGPSPTSANAQSGGSGGGQNPKERDAFVAIREETDQ